MIVGIIPARGGSKGVPRKNIRPLLGKPLIAWTIEAAQRSELLDDFYVSTEDEEIKSVAREYGAKVLDRPSELAKDDSLMVNVLKDVINTVPSDMVVLLQPTSPIRNEKLIDECIKKFVDSQADNLATGHMCNVFEYGRYPSNRQEGSEYFHNNGSVHIIRSELIQKASQEQARMGVRLGEKTEIILCDEELNYEIDTELEFWLVEQIMKKRLSDQDS